MHLEKHFFVDGLKEKNAYSKCPFCEVCDWRLLVNKVSDITNQTLMNFTLLHLKDASQDALAVTVVAMVCGGCGFVRLQARDHALGEFD